MNGGGSWISFGFHGFSGNCNWDFKGTWRGCEWNLDHQTWTKSFYKDVGFEQQNRGIETDPYGDFKNVRKIRTNRKRLVQQHGD